MQTQRPDTVGAGRQARRLVDEHLPRLATARRLRATVGTVAIAAALAGLVALLTTFRPAPVDDTIGTYLWGGEFLLRVAAAIGALWVAALVSRWLRAPWRTRSDAVDLLAAAVVEEGTAAAEARARDLPPVERWWSPTDLERLRLAIEDGLRDLVPRT